MPRTCRSNAADDPDVATYAIYRSTYSYFEPSESTLIADWWTDTTYADTEVDPAAPAGARPVP